MAQLNDLIVNGYSRFLNSAYGNLNGSATYALTANTALTANYALTAHKDSSGNVISSFYSPTSHNHSYKLSGNGTAVNVSAGVNFKPSGSNIKFYVSGNDIYISAKNDNSTAYIPSGFQVSGINGSTTGVYYLSALKISAGTNIGFTSASNSQITITAKDTTYTTANFITANKTAGVSSNGTNVGTVNLSAISFSAGSNVTLGTAANNIITITAKDTTYSTSNFIAASHLSNIQTASGYAADWNTNKTNVMNSAKSGAAASAWITGNSGTNSVYYVTATYNSTTYPNYDTTKTYATGAYIVTGSRVYSASAAVTTAGAWSTNSSKFTTANTTVVWTGNTTATGAVTTLTAGLKISLKVPSNMSGAATTQLNLNGLGAKTIRRNNGNLTTHLPFGTVVYLTYDGTYWVWADYDSNSNDRVGQYSATDNNNYPIILKRTTGGQETHTVKYSSAFTYNPSKSSLYVSNISSTNITGVTTSGTNILGDKGKFLSAEATTAVFNNTSSINLSGTNITATTFSGNLSGSATSALTSKSALSAGYAATTNTAIKVNSAIYLQDFSDGAYSVRLSWKSPDIAKVTPTATGWTINDTNCMAAWMVSGGVPVIKAVNAKNVWVNSANNADTVDGLHVATGTIGSATNYLYFC